MYQQYIGNFQMINYPWGWIAEPVDELLLAEVEEMFDKVTMDYGEKVAKLEELIASSKPWSDRVLYGIYITEQETGIARKAYGDFIGRNGWMYSQSRSPLNKHNPLVRKDIVSRDCNAVIALERADTKNRSPTAAEEAAWRSLKFHPGEKEIHGTAISRTDTDLYDFQFTLLERRGSEGIWDSYRIVHGDMYGPGVGFKSFRDTMGRFAELSEDWHLEYDVFKIKAIWRRFKKACGRLGVDPENLELALLP